MTTPDTSENPGTGTSGTGAVPSGSGGPVATVADLVAWLRRGSELLSEHAAELSELDAAIGDGDHGTNMKRGFAAVVAAVDGAEFATVDELMKKVGSTLVSTVGGASGPLYGTFFLRLGTSQKGVEALDVHALGAALRAGVDGISQRGKAMLGEKTMLDAWIPALDAYQRAADSLPMAIRAGADAAEQGRADSAALEARKGRASYLGERSVGHVDPGAASTALLWQAMVETIADSAPSGTDSSRDAGFDLADDEAATS
ncbi:dihydroxyacetone kinase subunit DhaL [Brachybacterium huguangmaarense]